MFFFMFSVSGLRRTPPEPILSTRDLPNGKRAEHLKNVFCFHFFWKSIFRSFTCFSLSIWMGKGQKNWTPGTCPGAGQSKCLLWGRGTYVDLFNFERLLFLQNVVWRKEGGEEGQSQELNNRMCSHNLGLETTTHTFMLHARPIPLCTWTFVKRSPHWSCDESKKTLFSGDLASSLVCARKLIWMHAFLLAYVCMWHTPIRTWTTSELRPSSGSQVHDTCALGVLNMSTDPLGVLKMSTASKTCQKLVKHVRS
jgi:hypothetical protein